MLTHHCLAVQWAAPLHHSALQALASAVHRRERCPGVQWARQMLLLPAVEPECRARLAPQKSS